MTDKSANPESKEPQANGGERIAKVMSRAGVASRREAERMILEGRVAVNGKVITSPALDVLPSDRITVDGKKVDEKQETRLWLYYKPAGLVTSEADEKGRQTVFDALPRDLPRVMTVGRLDLNSEGLLLLTNDGELKRRLELPSTGWLRRYRVRVNGQPNDLTFDPLRRGAVIDGEEFAPMEIKLDGQQGANAWLTVGIREGKNREIRRAMAHIGLQVNRLIRISYGPFRLTGMERNEVVEVKRRVLRDQLGGLLTGEADDKEREMRPRGPRADRPIRSGPGNGDRPIRRTSEGQGRDDTRPLRKFSAGKDGFARADRPKREDGDRPARYAGGAHRERDEGKPGRKVFASRGAAQHKDGARGWKKRDEAVGSAKGESGSGKPTVSRFGNASKGARSGRKPSGPQHGAKDGGKKTGWARPGQSPSRPHGGKPGRPGKPRS